MVKRIAIVLALTAVHYVISLGLFLGWLKMKMDLLEGDYRPLDAVEKMVKTSSEILSRPLVPLFPAVPVWVTFGINSLVWGIGLYLAGLLILRATGKRGPHRQVS